MGNNNQKPRAHALDALRGYAIITMVLSAMEAFSVLPRWMYHAQVPPPDHVFDPTIYGITWVDIIFPFFLFSMGAAIPLSLGRQHAKGESITKLTWKTVQRWVKLTFFAIFIIHAFPFMLGYEQEWMRYAMPISFFILLCLMFMPNPFGLSPYKARAITWSAYLVAVGFMLLQPYAGGAPFRLTDSDCIMLILANVSLTGSIIYLLTIGHPLRRLALLPFLIALFMAAHTANSWPAQLIHTSWLPWLYLPAYQEYLLIIIPGTVAGEWIAQWLEKMKVKDTGKDLVDNYQKKSEAVLENVNPLKGGRGAVLENENGVKDVEKVVLENEIKDEEQEVLENKEEKKGGREAVLENGNKVKNDEKVVLENENKVRTRSEEVKDKENALALPVALLSLVLIVTNVVLLFGRHLVANLIATIVLTALTAWLLRSRREAGTTGVEAAKQRAASKDASSQGAAKQEVSNREASSQGAVKQEGSNREASSQGAAEQEVSNREASSQGAAEQEVSNREASSQEAAKQEVSNQKSSSTPASPTLHFWQRLSSAGAYLLLLGLCLESYEGGIRKDDVTLSYLFVTCGLAFYALLLLTVVCDHWHVRWLCAPLEMVGKNPMVAYVSASMVIIPVLILTQLYPYIDALSSEPLTGFLKGVLLTALCMALTAWFTHKRWFWKT